MIYEKVVSLVPVPLVYLCVVYFDQLLGAARTQKLAEILVKGRFQPFLLIFKRFQCFNGFFSIEKSMKNV